MIFLKSIEYAINYDVGLCSACEHEGSVKDFTIKLYIMIIMFACYIHSLVKYLPPPFHYSSSSEPWKS